MVQLVREKLTRNSVDQYKLEERSIVAKRILSSGNRIKKLRAIVKEDDISIPENINMLKEHIHSLTLDVEFKKCYEDVSLKQILEQKIKLPNQDQI